MDRSFKCKYIPFHYDTEMLEKINTIREGEKSAAEVQRATADTGTGHVEAAPSE